MFGFEVSVALTDAAVAWVALSAPAVVGSIFDSVVVISVVLVAPVTHPAFPVALLDQFVAFAAPMDVVAVACAAGSVVVSDERCSAVPTVPGIHLVPPAVELNQPVA